MVNKAELRQFITQYFSDLELDELCFDYYPDLLNQFTSGMTKSQKVIALIGYCDRRGLTDHLLATLDRLRPEAYGEQFGLLPKRQASPHAAGRDPNRIFLSHANQDAAFTRQLADDLRHNGFDIWMAPESIEPGEKWVDAIERGLETSGIFVLVITPHAADSKWVRDESNYAIALQNKDEMRFFTLLVGEGRMPPMWSVRQHISFREDYDEGLRQLLAALSPDRFAARPAPPPASAVAPPVEPTKAPPPAATKPAPRKPAPRKPLATTPLPTPEKKPDATPKTAPPVEATPSRQPEPERTAAVSKAAEPLPESVKRAPRERLATVDKASTDLPIQSDNTVLDSNVPRNSRAFMPFLIALFLSGMWGLFIYYISFVLLNSRSVVLDIFMGVGGLLIGILIGLLSNKRMDEQSVPFMPQLIGISLPPITPQLIGISLPPIAFFLFSGYPFFAIFYAITASVGAYWQYRRYWKTWSIGDSQPEAVKPVPHERLAIVDTPSTDLPIQFDSTVVDSNVPRNSRAFMPFLIALFVSAICGSFFIILYLGSGLFGELNGGILLGVAGLLSGILIGWLSKIGMDRQRTPFMLQLIGISLPPLILFSLTGYLGLTGNLELIGIIFYSSIFAIPASIGAYWQYRR